MSDPTAEAAKGPQSDAPPMPTLGKNMLDILRLQAGAGLRAHFQKLELIDKELQRTHGTIQVKIQNREYFSEDLEFLKSLRQALFIGLDALQAEMVKK